MWENLSLEVSNKGAQSQKIAILRILDRAPEGD